MFFFFLNDFDTRTKCTVEKIDYVGGKKKKIAVALCAMVDDPNVRLISLHD